MQTGDSQPTPEELEFKRLHPTTLWVPLLQSLPGLVAIGVIVSVFLGFGAIFFAGFWYILLPIAALNVFRYISFRYRVLDSELIIRSGILWRHERRIPLSKVQDVRVRRGPIHRLFGVVKLEITTAASEQREAVLDTISTVEAALLKQVVVQNRGEDAPAADQEEPSEDYLLRLRSRDLLLGALSSKLVSTALAIFGAVLYFQLFLAVAGSFAEGWDFDFTEWEQWVIPNHWMARPVMAVLNWDDTLGGALLLIVGGLVFSLGRFVIRHSRFRLTRRGSVLSRTHGLLSISSSTFDRERIQALKVEEQWLRRWFGLATVWVDSGGDRAKVDDQKKRDPLVPVLERRRLSQLVGQMFVGLQNPEPELKKVSPKAVLRGSRIGWLILLVLIVPNSLALGWLSVALLPLFPLVYYFNLQWYRNRGYWIDQEHVISRHGWLTRQTLYLPVKNVQNLSVSQSYFDRRLNLATLSIDAAGQSNTGGGPSIRNLPVEEARKIQLDLSRRIAQAI
jgi:putative membrane protein